MSDQLLNLTLHVWRQKGADDAGHFETYQAQDITTHMSFLEMLDVVNEGLIEKGERDKKNGVPEECIVKFTPQMKDNPALQWQDFPQGAFCPEKLNSLIAPSREMYRRARVDRCQAQQPYIPGRS